MRRSEEFTYRLFGVGRGRLQVGAVGATEVASGLTQRFMFSQYYSRFLYMWVGGYDRAETSSTVDDRLHTPRAPHFFLCIAER